MFITSVPRGKATKKQIGQLKPDGDTLMINENTLAVYGDIVPAVLASFDYTGTVQTWTVPATGWYKLDVWGAGGAPLAGYTGHYDTNSRNKLNGGKGGYSTTTVKLTEGTVLYIVVGGHGYSSVEFGSGDDDYALNRKQDITGRPQDSTNQGGYNGGGYPNETSQERSGGGGATHIATTTGLLSDLENNQDAILIVAGGGGGAGHYASSEFGQGGSGGGIAGSIGKEEESSQSDYVGLGGTQSAGGTSVYGDAGSFGQGANRSTTDNYGGSGGGGGYYGGGSSVNTAGAGGGSGYITEAGKPEKSYMYGYKVPTDNHNFTKTYTTNNYSEIPTRNQAKVGDGYAIISRALTPLVPFSNDSTQDEIFNMIDAYYRGEISLDAIKTVQHVGDTIQANATTMSRFQINSHKAPTVYNGTSTVSNSTIPAQTTVKQTIVDFDHDLLETPINGKTKALITLRMAGCISNNAGASTYGSMPYAKNATATTEQDNSQLHNYLNGNFYNACGFNSYIKTVAKQCYDFNSVAEDYDLIISPDKVFLPSRQELQGYEEPSIVDHNLEGSVYELFKNASGRIVHYGQAGEGDAISDYQTRTKQPDATGNQYVHYYSGTSTYAAANANKYISPMLCL